MRRFVTATLVFLFLGFLNTASAGLIFGATTVTSPMGEDASGNRTLVNLINQSGFDSTYTSGSTDFDSFTGTVTNSLGGGSPSGAGNIWVSSGPTTGNVDFDFGQSLALTRVALWNFGQPGSATVNAFEVFSSSDATFTSLTGLGSFSISISDFAAQVFDVADAATQYLRLQINSNYGFSSFTGFGEFAVEATASGNVSLPSTLALVVLGLVSLYTRGRVRRA